MITQTTKGTAMLNNLTTVEIAVLETWAAKRETTVEETVRPLIRDFARELGVDPEDSDEDQLAHLERTRSKIEARIQARKDQEEAARAE